MQGNKPTNDITPLKDLYDFVKILFAVCLAIGVVMFTLTFSIILAYRLVGSV